MFGTRCLLSFILPLLAAIAFGTADFEKDNRLPNATPLEKGGKPVSFKGHKDVVHVLAFSHFEELMASGDDVGVVKLWDLKGRCQNTYTQHTKAITAVEFLQHGDDAILLTASMDSTFCLWSAKKSIRSQRFLGTVSCDVPIKTVAVIYSQKWFIAAGLENNCIRLYRLDFSDQGTPTDLKKSSFTLSINALGEINFPPPIATSIAFYRRDGILPPLTKEREKKSEGREKKETLRYDNVLQLVALNSSKAAVWDISEVLLEGYLPRNKEASQSLENDREAYKIGIVGQYDERCFYERSTSPQSLCKGSENSRIVKITRSKKCICVIDYPHDQKGLRHTNKVILSYPAAWTIHAIIAPANQNFLILSRQGKRANKIKLYRLPSSLGYTNSEFISD